MQLKEWNSTLPTIMQIEPMPERDGRRCWLSDDEQERITNHYEEEPRKQLAIELMLDGLRSEEVTEVFTEDFRCLEAEMDAFKLRIWESKTGYREAPVANDTRQRALMLKNARNLRKDEPLVDVTPRTIQRWVDTAADDIASEVKNEDWGYVSAHDLRRSWATSTYYSLAATPAARDLVMRWGGWVDADTFRRNYLGREPDALAAQMMQEAGLR